MASNNVKDKLLTFMFWLSGSIIVVILAVLHQNGGFMSSLDLLGQVSDTTVSSTPGIFASFFGPDPLSLFFVYILTSLGTWGLPQMVQKFYAIKDEKSIKKGTIISTIFALVVAGGSYFLGGFGRLFSDEIDVAANGYDSIIPTMLSGLSPMLIALVVSTTHLLNKNCKELMNEEE